MMRFNTCRICGKDNYDKSNPYDLIKYGVRHYAHPDCGLQRFGAAFFDRLQPWELELFPALAADSVGLLQELITRCKDNKAKHETMNYEAQTRDRICQQLEAAQK